MNTSKMTNAQLRAMLDELTAHVAEMREAQANADATPTPKRQANVMEDATPAGKIQARLQAKHSKPIDASKPRMVNPAKALDRGIRVNGERVTGRTFAVWHIDGNAKNRDSKRASVDGGSFLAITRDGLTAEDAKALANAWVSIAPKARKGATVTTCEDAWVVAKA
jgi:hypothetical protein